MTLDERNFNSRTSCEVRLAWKRYRQGKAEFQLTHLLRGATVATQNAIAMTAISTHAPLARCDTGWGAHQAEGIHFNSRTSCEVRRPNTLTTIRRRRFQLTHLLRGATMMDNNDPVIYIISTHAPLARCDPGGQREDQARNNFNSRTSCEVRLGNASLHVDVSDFNSRTSCEVRPISGFLTSGTYWISTHAPLARCDKKNLMKIFRPGISTHAPLARCDYDPTSAERGICHFNSRTSCEVRPTG